MSLEKSLKQKDISFEIMRILATFFVIFNHTERRGFVLFLNYNIHSLQFWLYLMIAVFCKFSVPVFFMISGALLLKKEESPKTVFKKRIIRIIVILFFISLLYYIVDVLNRTIPYYGTIKGSIVDFIIDFIIAFYSDNDHLKLHLWFLYRYIALLLILPIMQKAVKLMSKNDFIYFLTISVSVCVLSYIPQISVLSKFKLSGSFSFLSSNIILYPLLGYFLNYFVNLKKITVKKVLLLWGINFVFLLLSSFFTFYLIKTTGKTAETQVQDFFGMFQFFNATTVFITVKFLGNRIKNPTVNRIIVCIGSCTFGIYLIHPFFLECSYIEVFENIIVGILRNPMIGELTVCLLIFMMGFVLVFAFKKSVAWISRFRLTKKQAIDTSHT